MNYKLLRKTYGLTLDDIAKASGVTKQNVCKFEKGEYKNSRCEEVYNNLGDLHTKKYGTVCIIDWETTNKIYEPEEFPFY